MEVQVKAIQGNWDLGFVLHKHVLSSTYLGDDPNTGYPKFDTKRSEPGEALYKLKYGNDWSQVGPLASTIAAQIYPKFANVGLIVPMPPTKVRTKQPVYEVAKELGRLVGVSSFENLLVKNPAAQGAPQLKDLSTKEEKVTALKGRFAINNQINSAGVWNALLVDDLFDSGASMEAACATLRGYAKIGKIYVAALTWK